MKILHVTDSHGTVKGPESRKDIYYISFLKKLYELGFVVKRNKIDMVVHTGDLFHTARVSDKFAGQVSELIKALGVPFYVVPGNHDIEGYTTDTIDQTKLGLLAKTGVVTLLNRDNPIKITANQNGENYTVAISGQEYYAHIDEGNMKDFEMQQDEADLNILAIHGYLADTPQHPNIKCTMCGDVVSDADIILTGHYHRQFEWTDGQNLDIYNPGSMMRVEQTDYNKTHTPQYGILDINLNDQGQITWDYNFHAFRTAQPSTVIFDYNAKYKAKAVSITLDGFKNSISNTMTAVQPSMAIDKIISDICQQATVEASVEKEALNIYHNTLQTIPDEFEAQPGFVEAQNVKKIVRVELHNFQSHKDTIVDFSDGLNIIVGESNNGKTSIMRAIMWAIDNQPLGIDFITAGEDECWVTVCYDDGTSIKRGRTQKDTGYYDVYYNDENGTLQHANYRGFTNAVPVEVANVHQMPKINITKDIETHLNVLSQLDGPFLLTESPLVKASAIGRITGTHVIDAAIKETNKTIQSNKKLIKSYGKDIEEKENELKVLPDINIMSKFSNCYSAVVNRIKALKENTEQLQDYINLNQKYDASIKQYEETYNQCSMLLGIKHIVDTADKHLSDLSYLQSRVDSCNDHDKNIAKQEEIILQNTALRLMRPLVDSASALNSFVATINDKLFAINTMDINVQDLEKKSNLLKEYVSSTNSLNVHLKLLFDYVVKIEPSVNSVAEIEEEQTKTVNAIAIIKKSITAKRKAITKAQNEKNRFILTNGLCPCCGQTVNDSHIESISNFMGE